MAQTLEAFSKRLVESGLMSADDIQAVIESLPDGERPENGDRLARELVRLQKLTGYQCDEIVAGRGESLILGNYVVLDKLGQGGMGLVLKGVHRRMKRMVALKVLSPTVTRTPEALRRFQREVEAAARLRHPNIVAADDAAEANGIHFLVMEFVEGRDLSATVRQQGPVSVEQAVDYVIQAARGLEYAHRHGVVHRDIKPGNLLLDNEGHVKILDMGLARIDRDPRRADAAARESLTESGMIMGTIDYMSPEQAVDTRTVGPQADIYSLGATLYFLLTGKPVLTGDTAGKKLQALMTGRGIPVSISERRAEVPPALDVIFCRMTAHDLSVRYQSIEQVLVDLEAFRSDTESGSGVRGVSPAIAPVSSRVSRVVPVGRGTEAEALTNLAPTLVAPAIVEPRTDDSSDDSSSDRTLAGTAKTSTFLASTPNRSNRIRRFAAVAVLPLLGVLIWGAYQYAGRDHASETETTLKPTETATGWHGWAIDAPAPAISPFDVRQAQNHQEAWAAFLKVPVDFTNSLGMKFRLVPPGEFRQGLSEDDTAALQQGAAEFPFASDADRQAYLQNMTHDALPRKVTLTRPVYVATTEVTIGEFRRFVEATKYRPFAERTYGGYDLKSLKFDKSFTWETPGYAAGDDVPVTTVSWDDAVAFCEWLSRVEDRPYRLPTEAEWEFACRAGTETGFSTGDELTPSRDAACEGEVPAPVASFPANPFGLHDMHGNVWEFCADWFAPYPEGDVVDPRTGASGWIQSFRGGCCFFSREWCRSGNRSFGLQPPVWMRNNDIGFRIVCDLQPVPESPAIDLLPEVQTAGPGVTGVWTKTGGQLQLAALEGFAALPLPHPPAGAYRLKIRFRQPQQAGSLGVIFPAGSSHSLLVVDGWGEEHLSGFDLVGEMLLNNPANVSRTDVPRLIPGRTHDLELMVRPQSDVVSIVALLDHIPIVAWTGLQSELSLAEDTWNLPAPELLALAVGANPTVVEAISLQELSALQTTPGNYLLRFDGRTSAVEIPTLRVDHSSPLTIEAWVKPEALPTLGASPILILNRRPTGTTQINFSGPPLLFVGIRKDADDLNAPAVLGQLVHVAYVVTRDGSLFFVDGKLVDREQHAVIPAVPGGLSSSWMGAHPSKDSQLPSWHFSGAIGPVRISRIARYQTNFQPEWRWTADRDTVALYLLETGSGDILKDATGNGHHGRILNATWERLFDAPRRSRDAAAWHGWPVDAPPPAIAPFDTEAAGKHQAAWAAYLKLPVEYTNSLGMTFRLIPPGEFLMGTPAEVVKELFDRAASKNPQAYVDRESPPHCVILTQPFYLGVHEVTQRQYEAVIGVNPSHFSASGEGKDLVAGWDTSSFPVENVSWQQALEFCSALTLRENLQPPFHLSGDKLTRQTGNGYRLPTEAEWEFACRAGTTGQFGSSNSEPELAKCAWYYQNSGRRTHSIGELPANAFGLRDMLGNVAEFCQDYSADNYYGQFLDVPAIDPLGPAVFASGLRAIRGSDWRNGAMFCRIPHRHRYGFTATDAGWGMRVALSVDAVRRELVTMRPTKPNGRSATPRRPATPGEPARPLAGLVVRR